MRLLGGALIAQGTRLVGKYDSVVAYGQKRARGLDTANPAQRQFDRHRQPAGYRRGGLRWS